MISMLWAASGLNKMWPYLLAVLIVMVSLGVAWTQGRSSGQASARNKQLQDSLNRMQQEAQTRAEVQSTSTVNARKQLRERWSAR